MRSGTASVQNIRLKKSVSLACCLLVLVLCSSLTQAVYDASSHKSKSGGVANPSISERVLTSQEEVPSDADLDRIAWEYIVHKYSTSVSRKGLTHEELVRLANSMQACQRSDLTAQTEAENAVTAGVDTVSVPNARPQAPSLVDALPNCSRIIDSTTLSRDRALLNQSSFQELCPRLLYYIENPTCCNAGRKATGDTFSVPSQDDKGTSAGTAPDARGLLKKEKPSSSEVWGYGILLVTIISLSSLVGVSLMPFMAKDFYKHLLTVMIGLAVGSLTGSAVFHLLPQALRLNERDPSHGYLHISLVIVGGIWLFFMVERILKFIMDYKERKGKNWKREKMSSVLTSTPESSTIAVMTENGNLMKGPLVPEGNGEQRNSLIFPVAPRDTGVIYECQEQAIKASFGHQEKPRASNCHDHQVTFEQGKDSVIATVAWMIIFGDGLHNFIDGLSIGAAFNESTWTGVSISVAVLCEELPHELGDFAVLLNAGMSMRQAVTYNFLSACTCYIGMAVGILLGEIEASSYIFALAGGMFLYISLVDMVPEMNEIAQETSKVSVKKGLITLLLQNIGLFAGITTLYLLAMYQDSFQF